jgi:hypothetical protein
MPGACVSATHLTTVPSSPSRQGEQTVGIHIHPLRDGPLQRHLLPLSERRAKPYDRGTDINSPAANTMTSLPLIAPSF